VEAGLEGRFFGGVPVRSKVFAGREMNTNGVFLDMVLFCGDGRSYIRRGWRANKKFSRQAAVKAAISLHLFNFSAALKVFDRIIASPARDPGWDQSACLAR
jgi:hypothetical protein